jgi:hypothetical protein
LNRSAAGEDLEDIAIDIEREHIVGIGSVLTEQLVQLARQANGGPTEDMAQAVAVPTRSWRRLILAQMNRRSPWLRNAVRSGAGLGVAMLVVTNTSISFGFWVLLGVIAVLRFDALSTQRSAWEALTGTLLGVVIASGIIVVVGDRQWILWVLLPVAVFAAAWTPVVLKYPMAQAAFTGFVLLIVGLVDWPPSLQTGEIRIVDAALGAVIAVGVGVMLWPRGTSSALRQELAADTQAAWAYLRLILRSFVTPVPDDAREQALDASRLASVRGSEPYDVAVMQRGLGTPDSSQWAALTSDAHLMISIGRVFDPFTREVPLAKSSAGLSTAVTAVIDGTDRRLQELTRGPELESSNLLSPASPMTRPPITGRLDDAEQAHALVMTIWVLDWVARLNVIADATGRRVRQPESTGEM